MDRANLEALTEEDDEIAYENAASGAGSGSEDDDGASRCGKPNQFDNLCDGVVNNLALVHGSIEELLEFKDELLKQALPPSASTKLAIVTTRIFRSISDMHMPINELVRLVHLYSTPWEEKSTALKKLHEDFEAKKTQLNIALKRLEMVDSYAKKIQREKVVMNWERVFAKLTAAKGHGRRWKFLIESFKRKATLGMEHLQDYLEELDESSSEEEDEPEDEQTQMQHVDLSTSEDQSNKDGQEIEVDDEDSSEEDVDEDEEESKAIKSDVTSDLPSANEFVEYPIKVIKPPMADKECWTHEPVYDRYLHIRVYKPEELEYRELKCIINCGRNMYKTDILDPLPEPEPESKADKDEDTKKKKVPTATLR